MLQIALAIALPTKAHKGRAPTDVAGGAVMSSSMIADDDDDDDLNGSERTLQVSYRING